MSEYHGGRDGPQSAYHDIDAPLPPVEDPIADAYARVFARGDESVLLVLGDLARRCHAASDTQRSDPHETAFRNGERAVFLYLAHRLDLPLIPR